MLLRRNYYFFCFIQDILLITSLFPRIEQIRLRQNANRTGINNARNGKTNFLKVAETKT